MSVIRSHRSTKIVLMFALASCRHGAVASAVESGSSADEETAAEASSGGETTGSTSFGDSDSTGTTGPGDAGTTTVGMSLCAEIDGALTCPRSTLEASNREVHYQVPSGEPPPSGWPAVVLFQGSNSSAENFWTAAVDDAGRYNQTRVLARLLDHDYAVITPETKGDGTTFWDTNVPPYSFAWESSDDHALMLAIFAAIEGGDFGDLDATRLFAAGISSGGYMTSRMAVSYPGKFRALAIAGGSYATCLGPLCSIPDLDGAHPPTLFLHGEDDDVVPLWTAELYYNELVQADVDVRLVVQPDAGHKWIPQAADEIQLWFDLHP